jgi:uncharacterized membrane protein
MPCQFLSNQARLNLINTCCFGVLIGADILRLNEIASLDTPVAAIGGTSTFDGIFMTGIIAALLA